MYASSPRSCCFFGHINDAPPKKPDPLASLWVGQQLRVQEPTRSSCDFGPDMLPQSVSLLLA